MSDDPLIKSTPLLPKHVELGAKMVPFAGWNMPVQYTGIIDEHKAVRQSCGIFDISHMGQFIISGPSAASWLNSMLTNDISKLNVHQGQYTIMLNDQAGVIDDLIVYRIEPDVFFAVVNASKIDEDFAWLSAHLADGVTLENHSDDFVGLAVQGPTSSSVFATLFPPDQLPPHNGIQSYNHNGQNLIFCRTGYTGEDGFEFFCPADQGISWFTALIEAGATPCGLGARDSLRLEMCYPLNGSDLAPDKTPLEAGLGFFCALDTNFIGADILRAQKAEGVKQRLVALEYTDKGAPPRSHYSVLSETGEVIGQLTSGVLSPSLMKGIALAYLPADFAKVGTHVFVEVRGKKNPAVVVKKPFYKKA
jgi:aminomethyltransferase